MTMLTNEQAESAVLGSVLLSPGVLGMLDLEAEEFFHPGKRDVWGAMRSLAARKVPVDLLMLEEELRRQGRLDAVGGVGGVSKYAVSSYATTDPLHTQHHAGIVRKYALTRRVTAAGEAAREGVLQGLEGEELLAHALRAMLAVDVRRRDSFATMPTLIRQKFAEIDALQAANKEIAGMATGLRDLDELMGGLQRGVLCVVGGRTSKGKSALMRGIALHLAKSGRGTHVFSLEDSISSYVGRMLSDEAAVDLELLRRPARLRSGHIRSMGAAMERLVLLDRLGVEDPSGMSALRIAVNVRRRRAELQTDAVVVDYVQCMRERGMTQKERIDASIHGLADLAKEENLVLVVGSQVNRENEREKRRPKVHDLEGSGAIEQRADVVILVHRDDKETGVDVAKNKNGQTGWVGLKWDGPTATWRDAPTPSAVRDSEDPHWSEARA